MRSGHACVSWQTVEFQLSSEAVLTPPRTVVGMPKSKRNLEVLPPRNRKARTVYTWMLLFRPILLHQAYQSLCRFMEEVSFNYIYFHYLLCIPTNTHLYRIRIRQFHCCRWQLLCLLLLWDCHLCFDSVPPRCLWVFVR